MRSFDELAPRLARAAGAAALLACVVGPSTISFADEPGEGAGLEGLSDERIIGAIEAEREVLWAGFFPKLEAPGLPEKIEARGQMMRTKKKSTRDRHANHQDLPARRPDPDVVALTALEQPGPRQ